MKNSLVTKISIALATIALILGSGESDAADNHIDLQYCSCSLQKL